MGKKNEACAFCNGNLATDGSCVRCEGFHLDDEIIVQPKVLRVIKRDRQNPAYLVRLSRTAREWKEVLEEAKRKREPVQV
jgi:hypothetical protein